MSSSSLFPSSSPDTPPGTDPGRVLTGLLRERFAQPSAAVPVPLHADEPLRDPMASFDAESEIAPTVEGQTRPRWQWPRIVLLALAVAASVTAIVLAAGYAIARRTAPPVMTGDALVDSRPGGAEVVVDGTARGKTPLKLTLPAGEHTLEITGPSGTRSLSFTLQPGVQLSQYIELSVPRQQAGRLEISSTPSGASVRVNGAARGVTPLIIDQIQARRYTVSMSLGGATVSRAVTVNAGGTASVFAALDAATPAPGTVGGFISLNAPFEMQVYDEGRLIGTTMAERLMLPTGRHELELVSVPLQFRTTVTLNVRAGQATVTEVPIPNGELSVNALPWAEVLVDGRAVGTTPLANLSVPIGNHEVVWRHPEHGERRQTVTVAPSTPARIGVDFLQ
jgi:hypothetical protein